MVECDRQHFYMKDGGEEAAAEEADEAISIPNTSQSKR
jgi:hypothetical protein